LGQATEPAREAARALVHRAQAIGFGFKFGGAVIPQSGKTRISIFIDNAVLDEFRARAEKAGTGYQTMINDLTGMEIANASKVALRIGFSQVPFVAGARGYAAEWIFPGGSYDNQHYFESQVRFSPEIEIDRMPLFDAQTSGDCFCVCHRSAGLLLDNARRSAAALADR
jgi:uncharacterized protein (DUF4415 family)